MAKFKMPWRSVKKDGLPEKSGRYLVYDKKTGWSVAVPYSAKHKVFNADDDDFAEEAKALCIKVTHWIPLEEVIPDD